MGQGRDAAQRFLIERPHLLNDLNKKLRNKEEVTPQAKN